MIHLEHIRFYGSLFMQITSYSDLLRLPSSCSWREDAC